MSAIPVVRTGTVAPADTTGLRVRGQNAWLVYLATMAVLTGGYVLAHFSSAPGWLGSGLVFDLIGGAAVGALVIGAWRNPPGAARLPWYLLAAGQLLFVTSDVIAHNYERLFGSGLPFPSIADPFHLAFYPFLVAGMVLIVHNRNEHRDSAATVDAMIVTLALATLLWVYLIDPYTHADSLSVLRRATSIAYPIMDILVLGIVARVAAGSHRREPAFAFLLSGAVVLLLSDVIYGWKLLDGSVGTGGMPDAGWAVYYALLGTAVLHPSMAHLSEPGPEVDARLTRARLALLACASLTAPLVIVVREARGEDLDLYALIGASTLMFGLVLVRMAGIVRSNEEATRREAALRLAGESLVAAGSREEIYEAALNAARSVVREGVSACIYEMDAETGELRSVGCTNPGGPAVGSLRLADLPERVRSRMARERVLSIDEPDRVLSFAPLFVGQAIAGALAVRANRRLTPAAVASLESLAAEVALALRTVALTEASVNQRAEARLGSLIKNSSDVICILDKDGVVQYTSPSVKQTFGYSPEEVAGRSMAEYVHSDDAARVHAMVATVTAAPAGQPVTCEFRGRHADGSWRDVEALATNLLGDESIEGIVLNVRDISERKAFQAELEHQAFHDTLTGLPNRALFRNRVEHALISQRRERLPVAVLFLDIDDFKNINDSLGHAAGDEVLREVGRRLEDCMRPIDTAARLGGDEFAILIRQPESELQSIEIAGRVMQTLSATLRLDDRDITLASSVGIAFSDQGMISASDAEELLRNADAAMYMAKESGRGQYQVFQPEMHAKALARLELKTDLQRALDAGEFTLRYQPIMDLALGDMAGMEALVRWEHPVRGTIQPLDFVPLLEDTGLIVPVGRHILWEACEWAAEMQRAIPRDPPLSMAVNVSACQLQRPEFIQEVRAALESTQIVPSSLTLELTESVMMQDMEVSLMRLNALRELGVKLAIDDFGTGYSSLNYIRSLPVDILKIDRSFLADPNPEVEHLTSAIIQLARIFNLKSVAEGIESPGQVSRLQDVDCEFGQGFHFAKPLYGHEIMAMAEGADLLAPAREAAPQGPASA
jgi:diguanylate cyclase (GGDEF)-like protein/PAS domain S-box-containing protein